MAAKLLLLSPPRLSRPRNTNNNQLIKTTSAAADMVVAGRRLHSSAASAIQEYYRPNTRRFCHRSHGRRRPWLLHPPPPACRALLPVRSSLHETLSSSVVPVALAAHHLGLQHPRSPPLMTILLFLADSIVSGGGYSQASYYTSLGLFVISVPGLWSLIKRSVKSKIVQKTFTAVSDGEGNLMPNQVAGAILSFFARNNFVVLERGETITFEGMMVPSRSQAALLTFCTCISLASVALVLTITVPDAGNNWFWLTTLSPLAGAYYWTRASRKEQIKVKMIVAENGSLSEIIVQGDDQQVDRMRRELQLTEKGMVYVKGIFER